MEVLPYNTIDVMVEFKCCQGGGQLAAASCTSGHHTLSLADTKRLQNTLQAFKTKYEVLHDTTHDICTVVEAMGKQDTPHCIHSSTDCNLQDTAGLLQCLITRQPEQGEA